MSCKSAIYVANPTTTSVEEGAVVPLGSIVRRYGCNLNSLGNSIVLDGVGYYNVNVSVTLIPSAAGNTTITLYRDGIPVTGATATETTSATGQVVNLSIPALVRVQCCKASTALTLVLNESSASVTNVGMVVEKI